MTALIIYLFVALGFSFLCSIAEAVLLSTSTAYISLLEQQGKPVAALLKKLKSDIDSPLAAILSLNTIAHTMGAAGVGAQAAAVFGSQYLGVISGILTLLILVVSEIIPKTLGSYYWRSLAVPTAYSLKYLIFGLYPLVWFSKVLTQQLKGSPTLKGFSRDEFAAMAHLGKQEGQLSEHEASVLQNLFVLREEKVVDILTPKTVVFSVSETMTVKHFVEKHADVMFSRIPLYKGDPENIQGFILRSDILSAHIQGNGDLSLVNFKRDVTSVIDKTNVLSAFDLFVTKKIHLVLVVNEYGGIKGIITLEDILETLTGIEFVDEGDKNEDMQALAKAKWRKRAHDLGLDPD